MKKNLLSGRERELYNVAKQYERAKLDNQTTYLDVADCVNLVNWYITHNNYKTALEVVEDGLMLHPNHTALLVEKAHIAIDRLEIEKAKEIIASVSESYLPEVKMIQANLLILEKKIEEADNLVETIEGKEELDNLIDIAYMYAERGFPEKAMKWIERGKEKYAEMEAFIVLVAECLYLQGRYEEAVIFYNKLIDSNPYSALYWLGLARCHFEEKKYDLVIEACDYALVSEEDNGLAYLLKGNAFYELGNKKAALENYAMAEKYHAVSLAYLYTYRGIDKVDNHDWKGGYNDFEKAIKNWAEDAASLSFLYAHAGLCLYYMGKKRKAIKYCEKAQELNPDAKDPYIISGRICLEEGNYQEGLKYLTIAVIKSPGAHTWNEVGLCCMEVGAVQQARMAFEQVKKLDPNFANINFCLAVVCLFLQDLESFKKYNRECANPIFEEKMEEVEQLLKNSSSKDWKDIFLNLYKESL